MLDWPLVEKRERARKDGLGKGSQLLQSAMACLVKAGGYPSCPSCPYLYLGIPVADLGGRSVRQQLPEQTRRDEREKKVNGSSSSER